MTPTPPRHQLLRNRCVRGGVLLGIVLSMLSPASAQSPPPRTEAAPSQNAPAEAESSYRVLLLYSEARLTRSVVRADEAFRSRLEARSPRPVVFYTEFLDLNSFHGPDLQGEMAKLLAIKYHERPIDLIVAQGQLTVPFVLQHRDRLFSTPPVVFLGVESSTFADLPASAAVTGTWRHRGWQETFDLAWRLHPGIRQAVVVVGASAAERLWAESARQQLAGRQGAVEITYLIGAPADEVLRAVAALHSNAVVLAGPFLRDGSGADFSTPAFIGQMLAVSRVPIYGLTEGAVGTGVVGGYVVSFEAHGKAAADLALQVLAGQHPPPTTEGTTVVMFDDRQLGRWKIDRRLLPAGSVVLFREPSLWERYRLYIVGAGTLIAMQAALIGVLLMQRRQRRRAQRSLAERLRFETLLSNISTALASCPTSLIDREIIRGLRLIVEDLETDRATLWRLYDQDRKAYATHSWHRDGVPPMEAQPNEEQFPRLFDAARRGEVVRLPMPSASADESSRDRRSLSEQGTASTAIAPLVEGGGVIVGSLSVGTVFEARDWPDELLPRLQLLADVFANALARQRAEQAAEQSAEDIRSLAGRLLTAEEDERRRIGRELHDGVNQEVAALSIALTALEQRLPSDASARQEVAQLQARTVELSEGLRQLSHELHPGILQYAGLSAALRSHCREFDHGHDIAVRYESGEGLGEVAADVALCLYRVTQEALRNAAMHAKADHAAVTLTRDGTELVLTITDDGLGFDLEEARGRGLGLISLEERVRLVRGHLTIDTAPQCGTRMRVAVPIA